jgi:hypothetical protein
MDFNEASAKTLLERFDLSALFVNELGWDRHNAMLPIEISGASYTLKAIAEKRGMVAWLCDAPVGRQIPDRAIRKKIEHQVAKTTLEHLIIFIDRTDLVLGAARNGQTGGCHRTFLVCLVR